MASEKQITIIKRSERHEPQAAPTPTRKGRVRHSADRVERDAVTVVTEWVRELRSKKVTEAKRGFESLFSQAAASATRG